MSSAVPVAATVLEIGLILGGLAVLWRFALSPAARARPAVVLLSKWEIAPLNFLFFVWGIYAGGFLIQFLSFQLLQSVAGLSTEMKLVLASAGNDAGMIVAWLLAKPRLDPRPADSPPAVHGKMPWAAGVLTFLAAWPVVLLVMLIWQNGLEALGAPLEKQDSVDLFANAEGPLWVGFLLVFAVVLAPVTEELVYRGAIFRFVRGRLPRWLALVGPAALFAALHLNLASFAPLLTLALIFSLVYERTGDIRVTMIAHGLFNLNTALLIFAGIGM
ncbi:MAG TPA: CPBP family intramembrane glutamic endopeptidase [Opitutaceae bacterium]|nr:CPBP family intramembrane glutamic endopeptidase [Opitutaceae bacterium]